MLKYIYIFAFMVSSVALSAQLNFSGTTVNAPTANFPNFGSTSVSCALATTSEPYRVFTFSATNMTTVTVNFTDIIDGGATDDTGFSWYTGASFNPANACTNFIAVGENFGSTNQTINVIANTAYSIVVIGLFGTEDAFAFTLTAAAGSVVLPIELLSFTAINTDGRQNNLTWVTASELDNSHFVIERSTDGSTFHRIGQVKGNNKPSRYQFVDNQLFATSYYRLKQLDFDGRFEYSKIISIAQNGKNAVSVYPNPSNGVFSIVGAEDIEDEQFTLINNIGQTIVIAVQNDNQLDLSAYPSGVYYLRIASSGQVVKLIHQ
jgi:hypothetical protein